MYTLFIGSDMSKHFYDVSYYSKDRPVYLSRYSNEIDGFKKMVKDLRKIKKIPKSSWLVCFENTGVYSKAFFEWLVSQQIPCLEENALQISKSRGIRRGKNDQIDSKDICRYAYEKRDSLKAKTLPKPLITKLKKLLSRRNLLVRQKQSLSVSLKEQKQVMDPKLYKIMDVQNSQLLDLYTEQIRELDQMIEDTIGDDDEMKANYELAKSVVGVGPVISAYMIAITENFTCFENSRKYCTYCGIAPFPYQSGLMKGKSSISHIANKHMKGLLSNGVNAAIRYDKEIGFYYTRKLAEGKQKGVVLNAIKNKLVHRVFAVIKRQTPYVKMMNYA